MVRDVHGSIAGNQKTAENWYHNFGLQTFDLNVNQICSLLEKPDVENGEFTESIFYNMCTLICYINNCSSYIISVAMNVTLKVITPRAHARRG